MKIDVYDTYFRASDGHMMHFDVLVPNGTESAVAYSFAQKWLKSIGENPATLHVERCNFCHTEHIRPDWKKDIDSKGYYILKMEGCPE